MLSRFYSRSTPAVLIIVAITVLGIVDFLQLPIALYPNTSKPKVYAGLSTGSMAGTEFRRQYGDDIETALASAQDVTSVEGEYYNGRVRYNIEFDWGTESDDAKQRVKAAVSTYESQFPREWPNFWLYFDGADSGQVLVSIFSEKYSPAELAEIAESAIKPELDRIDGMGEAFMSRFDKRYVSIQLQPDALTAMGLSFRQVFDRIRAREHDQSLGRLDLDAGGRYQVTARVRHESLEDLKTMVIGRADGRAVRLRDVATIELEEDLPNRFFKGNGRRSLIMGGAPKPDANIQEVSATFLNIVNTKAAEIDPEIEVKVLLNPATFINEAVNNVFFAVLAGMSIATLVVFLFLGSFRYTLVVCIAIPLSLVGGFILMQGAGIELNLISLGAMALAVGMVVDGSIVVLENIVRHLQEAQVNTAGERLKAVIAAVAEVRAPIVASLLTTIIVFAPLPFTSPLAAAILGDLAVVMVCVLVFSVAVTLLIIPPLAMIFRFDGRAVERRRGAYRLAGGFMGLFRLLQLAYLRSLEFMMKRRWAALSVAALVVMLLTGAGWLITTQVEREVMAKPHTDKIFLFINVKDKELDIKQTEELLNRYEKAMLAEFGDDLSHILSQVREQRPWILAFLKDKSQIDRVKKDFEDYFKNTPQIRFFVYDWNPTSLEIPNPPMIQAFVAGEDEDKRRATLEAVQEEFRKVKDVGRIDANPRTYKDDYLEVILDREATLRLTTIGGQAPETAINQLISGYLSEQEVAELELSDEKVPVKIKYADGFVTSPGDLENLLIRVDGKVLPVKSFAEIVHRRDWGQHYSEDGQAVVSISAWAKESFAGDEKALAEQLKVAVRNNKDIAQGAIS